MQSQEIILSLLCLTTGANYLFPTGQRPYFWIWILKDCYDLDILFFSLFSHYFYQSATGVYLAALPTPGGIQIAGKTPNDGSYEQHISHMQKKINDTIAKNKELYEINPPVSEINLHCEYISYCLHVSVFLGSFKDFFLHCLNLLSLLLILSPSFISMLKCLIF